MTYAIEIKSNPKNMQFLRNFLRPLLDASPLEKESRLFVLLGVDEACTNIIRYAYHNEPNHLIRIFISIFPQHLRIHIRDFGSPINPQTISPRDLDDIRPGGLGVHFIQSTFDSVEYSPKKYGTSLVLTKNFPKN